MTNIVPLIISIIPAIALLIYFYRKDTQKPEPKGMILIAFILGIISIVPAVFIELLLGEYEKSLSPWTAITFKSFVVAAGAEEGIKLLFVILFLYNRKAFDEVTDGIIYTVTLSLGFACLENVLYSIDNLTIAFYRAFTAVPAHAIFSGIMGFYVGLSKIKPEQKGFLFLKAFLIGVFLHGLYDLIVFGSTHILKSVSNELYGIIPIVLIGVFVIVGFRFLKKKIKEAKMLDTEHKLS